MACVGDSITFGHPVPQDKAYPAILGTLLGDRYEVRNFGQNSATLSRIGNVPYWKTAPFTAATEYQPNIVIIALGANDSKVEAWMNPDQFQPDLKALIQHFRDLPSRPAVFVGIPIPVSPERTRGITAPKVRDQVTPMIVRVAGETHAPLVDFYTPLADHLDLLPDGIHPNAAGYRIMAEAARSALAKSGTLKESGSSNDGEYFRSHRRRRWLHRSQPRAPLGGEPTSPPLTARTQECF
ncbi:MAG: hypothetical protein K8T25_13040 [Planctomycetia bacterium]|nr:hypothetical protein [Planctomycetia bacterium]